MTRRCVLCNATNYKRTHSFFSAPKDPEIRKKWQTVIPVANYTVTDETYICSKHFKTSDIITHWISGIPPNVIKIKLKKCRLRVGAVPICNQNVVKNTPKLSDQLIGEEFESDEIITEELDMHQVIISEQNFQIPRQSATELICTNESATKNTENKDASQDIHAVFDRLATENNDISMDFEEIVDQSADYKTVEHGEMKNKSLSSKFVQAEKCSELVDYLNWQNEEIDTDNYRDVDEENSLEFHNPQEITNKKDLYGIACEINKKEMTGGEIVGENRRACLMYQPKVECVEQFNNESLDCDPMLFEDLLEIYTEATLPRGWTSLVTSKSQIMTVVYLYMGMSVNHIPIVEREVFVKSDMIMRCVVGNREINPFIYNLIKNGKDDRIRALSDIEELIEELDQQNICEGGPSIKNDENNDRDVYIEGEKWRHVECSIISNDESSKCLKCLSLNTTLSQKRRFSTEQKSNLQNTVRSLRMMIKNLSRRNRRLEEIRLSFKKRYRRVSENGHNTIRNTINSSNLPEIQKLMIKECLKESTYHTTKVVRYSQTWIFLCLLLYVESSRLYRYMFFNKYMPLPSIRTMKRYLNQIKIDPQFYNLFQRTVATYQTVDQPDEEEPM